MLSEHMAGGPMSHDSWGLGAVSSLVGAGRAVACALFLGAGVLRIARWRIAGDARSGLLGTALLLLGGVCLPLTNVARSVSADRPHSLFVLLTHSTTMTIVMLVAAAALVGTARSAQRPVVAGLVLRSVTAAVGGFAALLSVEIWARPPLATGPVPHVLAPSALAIGWLALGMVAARRGRSEPWAARLAPLLVWMGAAEALRMPGLLVWTALATAVTASVAALSAYCSLQDLMEATTSEDGDVRSLSNALTEARAVVSAHREWREEMAHDARNALAGLRGALHTLERYGGRLDQTAVDRLRAAAIEELGHLEHLIVRDDRRPGAFDVLEVVTTLVETRRALGARIDVTGSTVLAHGDTGDLATALRNVLVNAEIHAPGSPVQVHVARRADRVVVSVADQGPGVTAADPTEVFRRGGRADSSPGSGLGLYLARTLLDGQGGGIALRRAEAGDGATFDLWLPAAPWDEPAPAPVIVRRHRVPAAAPSRIGATS